MFLFFILDIWKFFMEHQSLMWASRPSQNCQATLWGIFETGKGSSIYPQGVRNVFFFGNFCVCMHGAQVGFY